MSLTEIVRMVFEARAPIADGGQPRIPQEIRSSSERNTPSRQVEIAPLVGRTAGDRSPAVS